MTRRIGLAALLAVFAGLFCPDRFSPANAQSVSPEKILEDLKKLYPQNSLHDAEAQKKEFTVHPDFEINLFATSPWVINPVSMTWDSRGRLWVINAPMYPHILPGQQPTDFISVLEDTDGDGRADKCTIFYRGLYVPTGIALGDGGVYVANQPDLLFLKDTNGDLVADQKQVFLSGFGTEDNHHAISAFRWSPGGALHFMSGVFLHTQVETPHGVVRLDDGGTLELNARTQKLGFLNRGTATNPWGLAFDLWGQMFLTEGPQGGIWYLAPATVSSFPHERVPGTAAPKACGNEFIYSTHFDEKYQGKMVLNAFKNKTVNLYEFSDDGAGFATKEMQPLMVVSNEPYFRPVDVKTGPDGAIYIADFFQEIIGHMQYEFRDPRRDHLNGRIWRITQKGKKTLAKPKIADLPTTELVQNLKSLEGFVREQTRRTLYERDAQEAAFALDQFVSSLDPKDPRIENHKLEALWCFQTIEVIRPKLLEDLLQSTEPRARTAAIHVLRYWIDKLPNARALLVERVVDSYPRARMESVIALSYLHDANAMEIAARAINYPMDKYLDYAIRNTAKALEDVWFPAFERGELSFSHDSLQLQTVLSATSSKKAIPKLLNLIAAPETTASQIDNLSSIVARIGDADVLGKLLNPAQFQKRPNGGRDVYQQVVRHVIDNIRDRKIVPAGADKIADALLKTSDADSLALGASLAGACHLKAFESSVNRLAMEQGGSMELRAAAIDAISAIGGALGKSSLQKLAATEKRPELRMAALCGLTRASIDDACKISIEMFRAEPGNLNLSPFLDAVMSRKNGAVSLASALANVAIHPDAAKIALRAMNDKGHQDEALLALFRKAAGVGELTKTLASTPMKTLIAEVLAKGNAKRGEAVFRRKDLACMSCHAIAGGGPKVGPDLEGLGTSSPMDYLIESVVDPDKRIREGFTSVTIATVDGEIFTGIPQARDSQSMTILDGSTRTLRKIALKDIEVTKPGKSIMPKNLPDNMTRAEFLDLLRFVNELGRSGEYATRNVPVIRSWRILDPKQSKLEPLDPHAAIPASLSKLRTEAWLPAYSKASGELPANDFARNGVGIARAKVEVGTPGKIKLRILDPTAVSLWIDDKPVAIEKETFVDLSRGMHSLTFALDRNVKRLSQGLTVYVEDAPGSPARAQVVNGP